MKILMMMAFLSVSLGAAMAQQPPIKMGLWEKNMTMNSSALGSRTIKSRSCITPAEWQELVGNVNKQQTPGCSIQVNKTAKGYSFNGTCENGQMVLSGSSTITDAEHIVAESHSTTTRNGQKRQNDTHSTSRWISADCGKIKPGDPEVEN